MKIAVLASGGGSNLQALLDARSAGQLGPTELQVVAVNIAGCGALLRAEKAGIPTIVLPHRNFAKREDFDLALGDALCARDVECLVLAGFMRIVGASFLERFTRGVINVHPALLPAFTGVNGQGQAFDYGVKVAGCTVHFVDGGVDTGPIIAQAVVPVADSDTSESLRLRILKQEHRLLPAVVRAHAEGRIERHGRRVSVVGGLGLPASTEPVLVSPT
jgi:phosphoribosylglycinamide formyltransferase 1